MKWFVPAGRVAALTASLAMATPVHLASAAPPAPAAKIPSSTTTSFRIPDVALDAQGGFSGQAVNLQGQPLAGATVVLDDGRQQAVTTADSQGHFRFDSVRGGAYRVQAGSQTTLCRAWKAGTAPPAANRGLMIVEGEQTALGQYCATPVGGGMSRARQVMSNPLVIGGLIAAAIAIPVALHNSDDDPAD